MVVPALPVAKLGALLIKQISKPIANLVKERAKTHPFFRRYVCMPPAHFYNWCEVKAKMLLLRSGKPVSIPILSEAQTIDLGATILGEGVIFGIATGILLFEYNRQAKKEAAKELSKKKEIEFLTSTITELCLHIKDQDREINEIKKSVNNLQQIKIFKPFKKLTGDNEDETENISSHSVDEVLEKLPTLLDGTYVTETNDGKKLDKNETIKIEKKHDKNSKNVSNKFNNGGGGSGLFNLNYSNENYEDTDIVLEALEYIQNGLFRPSEGVVNSNDDYLTLGLNYLNINKLII